MKEKYTRMEKLISNLQERAIKEFYQAFGTTFEESMKEFSKAISENITETMQNSMKEITDTIEQNMGKIVDMISNVSEKTKEKSRDLAESLSGDLEIITEKALQEADEKFKEIQEYSKRAHEQLIKLIEMSEKDPRVKPLLLMMSGVKMETDVKTGGVIANIGTKKIPIEQISTQQAIQAAMEGQFTESLLPEVQQINQLKAMNKKFDTMIGIMGLFASNLIMPTIKHAGTYLPTPEEQAQFKWSLIQGTGATLAGIGGMLTATGAGAAVGVPLMIAGNLMSLFGGMGAETEGALMRKAREEATTYRTLAHAIGSPELGLQAKKIYEALANAGWPLVNKEEMLSFMTNIGRLTDSMERLTEAAFFGQRAMMRGLTGEQIAGFYQFGGRIGEETMQEILRNVEVLRTIGGLPGGQTAAETVETAQMVQTYGARTGIVSAFSAGDSEKITELTAELEKIGLESTDMKNFIDAVFRQPVVIFRSFTLRGMSTDEMIRRLMSFIRNSFLRRRPPANEREIEILFQRGFYIPLMQFFNLQYEDSAVKIHQWVYSEGIVQKAGEEAKQLIEIRESYKEDAKRLNIREEPEGLLRLALNYPYMEWEKPIEGKVIKGQLYEVMKSIYGSKYPDIFKEEKDVEKIARKLMEKEGIKVEELERGFGPIYEETPDILESLKMGKEKQIGKEVNVGGVVTIKLAEGFESSLFKLIYEANNRFNREKGLTKAGE